MERAKKRRKRVKCSETNEPRMLARCSQHDGYNEIRHYEKCGTVSKAVIPVENNDDENKNERN